MKTLIIAASALLAGTAIAAQTAPVAPQAAPSAANAPMAHAMHDRTVSRTEVVQMVREHFGQMDTNKDGSITTAEIEQVHADRMKDFDKYKGRHHAMMMGDPNAAFDRLDTDKNGSISREEFAKAHEQREERRTARMERRQEATKDSPKDSKQVRKHVMRMHGPGGFGGRMMVMADTNGDGKITLAEVEAMALQHFDQMDANHDGKVTPDERRAAKPYMFKRTVDDKKAAS